MDIVLSTYEPFTITVNRVDITQTWQSKYFGQKKLRVENQNNITKIGKSMCSEWCVGVHVEGPWNRHGGLS
jgi:hypothetical protein